MLTACWNEQTFDVEELMSQAPSSMTTASVITDVTLIQDRVCQEDGKYFRGLAGYKYPIYADVTIDGLCRSAMEKEEGILKFHISPEMQKTSGEPEASPHTNGGGYSDVTVRGMSGKVDFVTNKELADYAIEPCAEIWNMPAPLIWGVPGQKIKIKITSYKPEVYKTPSVYNVGFTYVPVYL